MDYRNLKGATRSYLLFTLMMLCSFASTAAINHLVIFGDSLSDTGNTRSEVPLGSSGPVATIAGYGSNGRFSNGPLWHEYLAWGLGITPAINSENGGDNFAFGGARVDNDSGVSTGVLRQTNQYLARQAGAPSDTDSLFINWSGGNDVRDLVGNSSPIAVIEQQLDLLFGSLTDILDSGVSQLLVPNLPDLGAIPENRGTANQASATAVTQAWNDGLLSRLFDLNNSTTASIYFFDVYSLFDGLLANPSAVGITNTTGQCRSVTLGIFENQCSNPETYAFWDEIHPTTKAHSILGWASLQLISSGNTLQKNVVTASAPAAFLIFIIGVFTLIYQRKTK